MSVREIIYLDSERLVSLLSQVAGGVSVRGLESEVDGQTDTETTPGEERKVFSGVTQQLQRVREVRFFDHMLSDFMERISPGLVRLDADVKSRAETAIASGGIVAVSGALFFDDFSEISSFVGKVPSLLSYFDKVTKATGVATPKTNRQVQAERAKVHFAGGQIEAVGKLLEAVYGESIECGMVFAAPPSTIVVRAVLDRAYMRESMPVIVSRYGVKTVAHFTIVGTVTRASWMASTIPDVGSGSGGSLRTMIQQGQSAVDQFREETMMLGGADSISVAPLAVFRELQVGADVSVNKT